MLHRNDGGFARPLLGELGPAVDQIVEQRAVVRAEPRERHVIVGRHEDIDVIDLQQAESADRAAEVVAGARARAVEALRGQRDAARVGERQRVGGSTLGSPRHARPVHASHALRPSSFAAFPPRILFLSASAMGRAAMLSFMSVRLPI